MNQPSLDELLRHVDSKYTLVLLAAKRARMLTESNYLVEQDKFIKPVTKALHEIAEGKISFERRKVGIK